VTDSQDAALAAMARDLQHLIGNSDRMEERLDKIEDRLRIVENNIAGRVKPASVIGAVSASVAVLMALFYVLDRFYHQGS
jgi:hypothetical protein